MRKADLELIEMNLEPLRTARDRMENRINSLEGITVEQLERIKDLERGKDANDTAIAQGLASVRSMLQRNDKLSRKLDAAEEEETPPGMPAVDNPVPEPQRVRMHGNKFLL